MNRYLVKLPVRAEKIANSKTGRYSHSRCSIASLAYSLAPAMDGSME